MPASNMLVQLLAMYTNPQSHNAQRHRQTDRHNYNSRSYCVAQYDRLKLFFYLLTSG